MLGPDDLTEEEIRVADVEELLSDRGFEKDGDSFFHPNGDVVSAGPLGWSYVLDPGGLQMEASGEGAESLRRYLERMLGPTERQKTC